MSRTPGLGPPELDRALAAYDELIDRVSLDVLSEDAVHELVGDLLGGPPPPAVLGLAANAGGNPRLVIDLVEGLREEGRLDSDDAHRVPARVRRSVNRVLAGLSVQAQQVTRVGAVVGHSLLLEHVARALDTSTASLLVPLAEVMGAGLMRYEDEHVTFHNRIIRMAVLDAIPLPVRRALSHEIAQLVNTPESAATEPALQDLRPAGTVDAVRSLVAAGYVREAIDLARRVLDSPMEPALAAEIRSVQAELLVVSGQAQAGVREAEAALATPGLSHELAEAVGATRLLGLLCLNPALAHTAIDDERGETTTRPIGPLGAMATAVRSDIAWTAGDIAAGLRLGRAAARSSDETVPWPRLALADKLVGIGEFAEAEAILDATEAQLARQHLRAYLVPCATIRAMARFRSGHLDEAEQHARHAVTIGDRFNTLLLVPLAYTVLARLALLSGNLRNAEKYLRQYRRRSASGQGYPHSPQFDFVELLVVAARDGLGCAGKLLGGPMVGLVRRIPLMLQEPAASAWCVRAAQAADDPQLAALAVAAVESLAAANPDFPTVATAARHASSAHEGTLAGIAHAAVEHRDQWARDLARTDLETLVLRLERGRPDGPAGNDRPPVRLTTLTATELRVARLVAAGLTNRQAAVQLNVSSHTVNYHLRGIYRKLDITSRLELVALRPQLME
ncbi:hypothetical protein ENC19_13715 [Verrucosispora sp. CWR15]|uniref:HTH luxR-type domain-containing protein n=1 Tax=Verrucosispora sioxanthis TaxID=2499994 RepID=A0A6M1KWR6_9ACTN|nr:LuxR family transcriptional regulator [Verrucosispora sioxanthis]NEE64535.1 hypothetical protein [Verrucosispora sioxanthis]NGM13645.1 hypothetical protein [Verrucosispora sioxanthis]